jgi:hypothetical protein
MQHTHITTAASALAVWYAVSLLTLGTPKALQADDRLHSGQTVSEVAALYTEQQPGAFVLPSELSLSAVDHHVPRAHAAHRSWSAGHASVDLQVPETLVWTLVIEERDSRTVDLQVPKALLSILYTEGHVQGHRGD